jgi:hypothetical protein
MNTIEIEVSKTVKETKTVELPLYRKGSCHAYKVISKDTCIQVRYALNDDLQISICDTSLAFHGTSEVECTEAEFMKLYKTTLNKINNLVK